MITTDQPIDGVLFDFDGTLTTPGHLDFAAMRLAIGCPDGVSVLLYIDTLEPDAQARARRVLDRFELDAAANAEAAPGSFELIEFLRSREIRLGIITRNTFASVMRSFERFEFTSPADFDCIITRDDDIPVKPEPHGVFEASQRMQVPTRHLVVVGDYLYDIEAGRRAGARTVFIEGSAPRNYEAPNADYFVGDLRSLITLFSGLFRGGNGRREQRMRPALNGSS
jgi:hydrogenase expression/formation protein HypE